MQLQPPYSKNGSRPLANDHDSFYTRPSIDGLLQSDTCPQLLLHLARDNDDDCSQQQDYIGTFKIDAEANKS
ncbi:MAG TPA: hypothetical protein VHA09_06280 [Nitrososphaera sp.]|nr:hypothetical protein [Nitrososphaera sp.]